MINTIAPSPLTLQLRLELSLERACRAVDRDIERNGAVSAETVDLVRAALFLKEEADAMPAALLAAADRAGEVVASMPARRADDPAPAAWLDWRSLNVSMNPSEIDFVIGTTPSYRDDEPNQFARRLVTNVLAYLNDGPLSHAAASTKGCAGGN